MAPGAAARVRLIVWCKACGRQVEPNPAEMVGNFTSPPPQRKPTCTRARPYSGKSWGRGAGAASKWRVGRVARNSIDALPRVSSRMLGTPSLTAKDNVIGARVQNFRCRQPEGSGSSDIWRVA